MILGSGYVVENILFTLSAYNLSQIDIYARNNTRIQYIDKHFKLMFLNLNTQFNCILQNPQNININNKNKKIDEMFKH